jgi:hypothetical protein
MTEFCGGEKSFCLALEPRLKIEAKTFSLRKSLLRENFSTIPFLKDFASKVQNITRASY